jgi:hypothetical protein
MTARVAITLLRGVCVCGNCLPLLRIMFHLLVTVCAFVFVGTE